MHLNLPILDALRDCERVLVAGAGGGFDVVCGLPLYFELREAGKEVHLASLSFSELTEEDAVSLAAIHALDDLPVRLLACVGFGSEPEVTHAHIFENVAELARAGDFLGSCSLVRGMACYDAYEDAVTFIHDQPYQDPSVINASIVSAVRGHYGDFHLTEKTRGSRLWISPLMPIYWFFGLQAVAERSFFLSQLGQTRTFREARQALFDAYRLIPRRPPSRIPLL